MASKKSRKSKLSSKHSRKHSHKPDQLHNINRGKNRNSKSNVKSRGVRKSHHSIHTKKIIPREPTIHERPSKANSNMGLTDLQFMAKSRGIPFGGLNKTQLVRKINEY